MQNLLSKSRMGILSNSKEVSTEKILRNAFGDSTIFSSLMFYSTAIDSITRSLVIYDHRWLSDKTQKSILEVIGKLPGDTQAQNLDWAYNFFVDIMDTEANAVVALTPEQVEVLKKIQHLLIEDEDLMSKAYRSFSDQFLKRVDWTLLL